MADEGQHERRQDVALPGREPGDGQPAQIDAEPDDQHQPQPEARHRLSDQRDQTRAPCRSRCPRAVPRRSRAAPQRQWRCRSRSPPAAASPANARRSATIRTDDTGRSCPDRHAPRDPPKPANCTGSGRSSPSSCSILATASGEASGPARLIARFPDRRDSVKLITRTVRQTRTAKSRERRRNRITPGQPGLTDTSRQAGSRPDRSRSNVHRSTISVTASVPATICPWVSFVRLI